MLSSPKKFFHAMEAVLYIAQQPGVTPVSSRDIAAQQDLQPRYLEQMLQKLVKSGILRGVRGPSGGYLLAREKRKITLSDIYLVVRESDLPIEPAPGSLGDTVISPIWRNLQAEMIERLQTVTIAELCDRSARLLKARPPSKVADFTI
jgi:Rrf2 family transcriptional regulator, iron-sulfur cluster assembly transcription factor